MSLTQYTKRKRDKFQEFYLKFIAKQSSDLT